MLWGPLPHGKPHPALSQRQMGSQPASAPRRFTAWCQQSQDAWRQKVKS